jgi:hypothetical protein
MGSPVSSSTSNNSCRYSCSVFLDTLDVFRRMSISQSESSFEVPLACDPNKIMSASGSFPCILALINPIICFSFGFTVIFYKDKKYFRILVPLVPETCRFAEQARLSRWCGRMSGCRRIESMLVVVSYFTCAYVFCRKRAGPSDGKAYLLCKMAIRLAFQHSFY